MAFLLNLNVYAVCLEHNLNERILNNENVDNISQVGEEICLTTGSKPLRSVFNDEQKKIGAEILHKLSNCTSCHGVSVNNENDPSPNAYTAQVALESLLSGRKLPNDIYPAPPAPTIESAIFSRVIAEAITTLGNDIQTAKTEVEKKKAEEVFENFKEITKFYFKKNSNYFKAVSEVALDTGSEIFNEDSFQNISKKKEEEIIKLENIISSLGSKNPLDKNYSRKDKLPGWIESLHRVKNKYRKPKSEHFESLRSLAQNGVDSISDNFYEVDFPKDIIEKMLIEDTVLNSDEENKLSMFINQLEDVRSKAKDKSKKLRQFYDNTLTQAANDLDCRITEKGSIDQIRYNEQIEEFEQYHNGQFGFKERKFNCEPHHLDRTKWTTQKVEHLSSNKSLDARKQSCGLYPNLKEFIQCKNLGCEK